MTTLARDYADAYLTAHRWLFTHCPPWRWLLSAAMVPGAPVHRSLRSLAEAATR